MATDEPRVVTGEQLTRMTGRLADAWTAIEAVVPMTPEREAAIRNYAVLYSRLQQDIVGLLWDQEPEPAEAVCDGEFPVINYRWGP